MPITLAAILVPGWLTVPSLAVIAFVLMSYWARLGGEDVPASRRRIRRVSVAIALGGLPLLAYALSGADPAVVPRAFVIAWSLVMAIVAIVVGTAVADAGNSVRLYFRARAAIADRARRELRKALFEDAGGEGDA